MDLVLAGIKPLSIFANRQKTAVISILNKVRIDIGCKHVGHVFSVRGKRKDETFVSVTYPGKWLLNYALRSYFSIDPVISHPSRTSRPLILNELSEGDTAIRDFVDDARRYGLGRSFVSFPVMPFSGTPGSVMFSFDLEYCEFESFFEMKGEILRKAARDVHLAIVGVRGFSEVVLPEGILTALERAVLASFAEGSTIAATALALNIPETDVAEHLGRACTALECRNVMQAIAKAVGQGLIDIDVNATRPRAGFVPSQDGQGIRH